MTDAVSVSVQKLPELK